MARSLLALLMFCASLLAGCELVADFDRDKIPVERPDGGSTDAPFPDAASPVEDAAIPEDAAASDAAPDGADGGVDVNAGDDEDAGA